LRFVLVILKAARAVDAILLASVTDAAEAEGVLGMEGSLASTQSGPHDVEARRRDDMEKRWHTATIQCVEAKKIVHFGSPGHIFGHEGRHEP
jgi:hypothetical protein